MVPPAAHAAATETAPASGAYSVTHATAQPLRLAALCWAAPDRVPRARTSVLDQRAHGQVGPHVARLARVRELAVAVVHRDDDAGVLGLDNLQAQPRKEESHNVGGQLGVRVGRTQRRMRLYCHSRATLPHYLHGLFNLRNRQRGPKRVAAGTLDVSHARLA
jgi:hypothetical protein